jgi:hypothetical protein
MTSVRVSGNYAQEHEVSTKPVHSTLHKDLQLLKKMAIWAMKLLYEKKKQRIESGCMRCS